MKFGTIYTKFIILSLIFASFTLNLKLKSENLNKQIGIEQQTLIMNIVNKDSQPIASGEISLKLFQNAQEVNGTNRYVGYWIGDIKSANKNATISTPFRFIDEIPNFGRLIDSKTIHIDFRYILGCNFEVLEESSVMKVSFKMISKESTTQTVDDISFVIDSNKNKIDDVKKYFDNIQKICQSTQETITLFKTLLSDIIKENVQMKSGRAKISSTGGMGSTTNIDSSIQSESNLGVVMPGNPPFKNRGLIINDILDPKIKNSLKSLDELIDRENKNLKSFVEKKEDLLKRSVQIMDKKDKDNQQLAANEPLEKQNSENVKSANEAITDANTSIENINKNNLELNSSLNELIAEKTKKSEKMTALNTDLDSLKNDRNIDSESQHKIKKSIGELEASIAVETDEIKTIGEKKDLSLEKFNSVTGLLKNGVEDLESNSKTLNTLQASYDSLSEESKKAEQKITELDTELVAAIKANEQGNTLKIDQNQISKLQTEHQSSVTNLSELELVLQGKKNYASDLIDPQWSKILNEAFDEIKNKDNFDQESYQKILKTIPTFVWNFTS